jgi:hypothetical protein
MNSKIAPFISTAIHINRQHLQLALVLVSLAMLVLGVGAPTDGGGTGK